MKKMIMMAAMAAMFSAGAMAQGGDPIMAGNGTSYVYENFIQVTGKAEKLVVPDEIYVRIEINESEMKLKKSVETMEQDMIKMLRSLGIDTDKDLKIDNMSSNFKDYFLKKGQARTSAAYQLKVGSAAQLGQVYQGMESVGISNISITKLSHSRIKEFQREVRIEAIKDAKQIATELTGAIGQKIGRAVNIIDYNNDFYIPAPQARGDVMYAKAAGGANGFYETELDFNEIKLTYSVTVKFALDGAAR